MAESEGVRALVLELVDGLTLEERLGRGAMPLGETLAVARQIAGALESAHEQGVIHRDLKPANIKIRTDGTVKVLDFGIAKALGREGALSALSEDATIAATSPGVVLGTVAYMSPEQARGQDVTRRSDVWAFGVVLYQMLTGQPPFRGATPSDVLAAVLRGTPNWSALPPTTPPGIARLVRRCLERDPKARVHDMGDARLDVEDVEKELAGEGGPGPATPLSSRRTWVPPVLIGLTTLVVLAVIAWGAYLAGTRRAPVPAAEVRLSLSPPRGTHFVSVPAWSRDGRQLVFVAVPDTGGPTRLWHRPLDADEATPLSGTEDASYPFWSADNRSVAFFAAGKLKRVDVTRGGMPITVCDAAAGRGGAWLDDDSIVFAPSQFSPLMRVSLAGDRPAPLTQLAADETGHRFPQLMPGRQLLYYSTNRVTQKSGTRLISLDAPERAIDLVAGAGVAEYVNGFLVLVRDDMLMAQQLTLPAGRLTGDPIELGRSRTSETYGRHVMSTGPTGVVAFLPPPEPVGELTWINRSGSVLGTVGSAAVQSGVELSPNGGQMVATSRAGNIWLLDPNHPVPNQLTRGRHRFPVWSPDGARLATASQPGVGQFQLVTTAVATGNVVPLAQASLQQLKPMGWTRNGKTFVWVQTADKATERAIWMMPVDDPGKATSYSGGRRPESRGPALTRRQLDRLCHGSIRPAGNRSATLSRLRRPALRLD